MQVSTNPMEKKTQNYVSTEGDVYILGDFDSSISENVIPTMVKRIQDLSNQAEPILRIFINSCGGYCHELYGLLSLIEMAKKQGITVVTINLGMAYSCGSMLAIVGDYRIMYKYAKNLMHLGRQGDSHSTQLQIDRYVKRAKDHFENIIEIYKTHTKMPEKMIREVLKDDDYFLNAQECLEYGLVDEILGVEPEEKIVDIEVKDGEVIKLKDSRVKVRFIKVPEKEQKKKSSKSKKESNGKGKGLSK